jgi:hypothetical protein
MSILLDAAVISLARDIPAPHMFPIHAVAESARRAVEADGRVALNYGRLTARSLKGGPDEPMCSELHLEHEVDHGRL